MRLGFFDGSPFKSLGKDRVCSDEHIEVAAEAAREGVVLLKNGNETLPLDAAKFKNIAVIGLDRMPILQQQWVEIMQFLTKFTTQNSINLWLAILTRNLICATNFISVSLVDMLHHLMTSLHIKK